jgi:hypothetical protein
VAIAPTVRRLSERDRAVGGNSPGGGVRAGTMEPHAGPGAGPGRPSGPGARLALAQIHSVTSMCGDRILRQLLAATAWSVHCAWSQTHGPLRVVGVQRLSVLWPADTRCDMVGSEQCCVPAGGTMVDCGGGCVVCWVLGCPRGPAPRPVPRDRPRISVLPGKVDTRRAGRRSRLSGARPAPRNQTGGGPDMAPDAVRTAVPGKPPEFVVSDRVPVARVARRRYPRRSNPGHAVGAG